MTESITDIVDALHTGNLEVLTAASLGRIWQHVQDLNTQSFAMLTPWRASMSLEENQKNLTAFREHLRGLGLGFIQLIGHWREEREPSFFVPGMTLKQAHSLGNLFNQDAVVYGGPDAEAHVVLVFKDGRIEHLADHFTPQALGESFSELAGRKGRKFTFVTAAAGSQAEFLAATTYERNHYDGQLPLYSAMTKL